jgi:hypothetical protein
MGGYLYIIRHPWNRRLLTAGGLFTMSLVFRTVDNAVCAALSAGTHFLWHILNAWLLYLLVSLLIQQKSQYTKSARGEP